MNKVILIGRLGKDPESVQLQSGMAKALMTLATNGYRDKEGNERTDWHRLVAFGKTAETMSTHLSKGRMISIEGRLQTRSFDKGGEKRFITEVVVDRFEFLSPKNGNGHSAAAPPSASKQEDVPQGTDDGYEGGEDDGGDDDVPF